MRNRGPIKTFGSREQSLSYRGGTSYSGNFSVMTYHIAVPPSYVARNLIRRATHHIKGLRKAMPKAVGGVPTIYLSSCVSAQTVINCGTKKRP